MSLSFYVATGDPVTDAFDTAFPFLFYGNIACGVVACATSFVGPQLAIVARCFSAAALLLAAWPAVRLATVLRLWTWHPDWTLFVFFALPAVVAVLSSALSWRSRNETAP